MTVVAQGLTIRRWSVVTCCCCVGQVNKQKEEVILDHLHETAYQGTGLGRTILGPEVRLWAGRAGPSWAKEAHEHDMQGGRRCSDRG